MSWTSRRGEKHYYCTVSGGYVIFGHWMHGVPLSNTDEHCVLEAFMKGQFHPQIKEHMGEAIFKEVHSKVSHLVELKNQKTAAPLKSS